MKSLLVNPTSFYFTGKISGNDSADSEKKDKVNFAEMLQNKLAEVNNLKKEADRITENFLAGEPVELHEVMLSIEKAELALQLTVQVRNKLLEAYQEISRMQI